MWVGKVQGGSVHISLGTEVAKFSGLPCFLSVWEFEVCDARFLFAAQVIMSQGLHMLSMMQTRKEKPLKSLLLELQLEMGSQTQRSSMLPMQILHTRMDLSAKNCTQQQRSPLEFAPGQSISVTHFLHFVTLLW